MEPYQQRVIEERDALLAKTTALAAFLASSRADALAPDEAKRMARQRRLMAEYGQVLDERIAAFAA